MTLFPFPGDVRGRPEVVGAFDDEAAASRCSMNSDVCDAFSYSSGEYVLPCHHESEVLPVTPESSPSSTPDMLSAGFSVFPSATAVGTRPPCFDAFSPQFPPPVSAAYSGYAESGFVTPEMSPLDGRQQLSPPNLLPVLPPSCYVAWPNAAQSFYSHAQSFEHISVHEHRSLTIENYAHHSTGISFKHETETGNRIGAGTGGAGDDLPRISCCIRQPWDLTLPYTSGTHRMTSRPPYCDVITENDGSSFGNLLPARAPSTDYCSYRQFSNPDCGDALPWYLQLPECPQLDSDLSVADVEPAELDQYLNRKSMSPTSGVGDETSHAAVCVEPPPEIRIKQEVGPDAHAPTPSTLSPDVVFRSADCDTGSSFFDMPVDFSNSRLGSLSDIMLAEAQTNHAGNAAGLSPHCSDAFLETLTGSRYSTSGVSAPADNAKAEMEIYNTSTSPLGHLLSEDDVLPAPRSIFEAGEQRRETLPLDTEDILTFPISDCGDYGNITDAVITSSLLL